MSKQDCTGLLGRVVRLGLLDRAALQDVAGSTGPLCYNLSRHSANSHRVQIAQ